MPILLSAVRLSSLIEVDAISGEVIPYTPQQVLAIQDSADALARRLTPSAAPTL